MQSTSVWRPLSWLRPEANVGVEELRLLTASELCRRLGVQLPADGWDDDQGSTTAALDQAALVARKVRAA